MNNPGTSPSSNTKPPTALPVNAASIPDKLKTYANWVMWSWTLRDGKWDKPPYDAKANGTLKNASTTNPSTWASFDVAHEKYETDRNTYDGIGIVLRGTPFIGVDFDGVIHNGKIEPYILAILEILGSYYEITPSGTGIRTFVECPTLPKGKRKFNGEDPQKEHEKYGAEIYIGNEGGRYLTLTGGKSSGNDIKVHENVNLPYFLISQIANEKFKALWTGDTSAYEGDDSSADLALAAMLVRLLNGNAELVEQYFSASALGQRGKWSRKNSEGVYDYRERTIKKALESGSASARHDPTGYDPFRFYADYTSSPGSQVGSQVGTQKRTRVANFVSGETVKMKKHIWIWKGRLIGNGLNAFSGEPGNGKSTVASDIIAAITTGANFPDGTVNGLGPKMVLIICDEEGREDTITPRLVLAGADMSKVKFLEIQLQNEAGETIEQCETRLDEDLPIIEAKLKEYPDIVLIVPDPVTAYLGKADPNLDKEVGPIYSKLLAVSKRNQVAWLLISHFNKNQYASAINRNSGAKVMVTKPRCNWLFVADPHVPDRFLMLRGKNNIAKRKAMAFYIDARDLEAQDENGGPLLLDNITCIRWDGETDDDANKILSDSVDFKDQEKSSVAMFLSETLANGPRRATEIYQLAENKHIKYEPLKRNQKVIKQQINTPSGTEWWWANSEEELEALREQYAPQTASREGSDDGPEDDSDSSVADFLDTLIGDSTMPVEIIKGAAVARGLNWETVRTAHRRRGYKGTKENGVQCWQKKIDPDQASFADCAMVAEESPF